ncbi:hypothetical protein [Sporosarcina trichiuri]|uniref:hypothetical protein n=1 Tax=Sporosarcina trichiuri TaxID=3056445 RepID=UPI0025B3CF51|nr:hypothetical protein [Sporosarcina sp. 0.2-SM1T-5]WJY27072.1 hypothetical protein QWT68_13635 [Sporosarcina sp. 0.2-SM1T-5]
MLKMGMKRMFLLLAFCLVLSPIALAGNYSAESEEGTVVYQFQYDYDSIYALLSMDKKEYDEHWKKGLSIAEMAEKQGVLRRDLVSYFVDFHYKEMQKWREKGTLSEKHYFELVYILQADIEEFIDRNPNK